MFDLLHTGFGYLAFTLRRAFRLLDEAMKHDDALANEGAKEQLDTQIEISKAAGLGDAKILSDIQERLTRIMMLLRGLIRALKAGSE